MKAHGLARLGRDAEIRHTSQGEAVLSLSLAFSYGKRGEDGKRPTQWVEASFWGKRAEALAPYLTKGSQVVAYLDDVRIETYEGRSGAGHKLAARVSDVELVAQVSQGSDSAPAQRQDRAPAPAPRRVPAPAASSSGFDDMDDDIPF